MEIGGEGASKSGQSIEKGGRDKGKCEKCKWLNQIRHTQDEILRYIAENGIKKQGTEARKNCLKQRSEARKKQSICFHLSA